MKRNLLLLAVLAVFGFSSLAVAQDPGTADTLYIEIWDKDDSLSGDVPYHVRVPLYITHDVPDPAQDSLAGTVIPLCYTHSNAAKYCSVSIWWNGLSVQPFPESYLNRSVFRHLPDFATATVHNWTMDITDEYWLNMDWDTRILDLGDQVSRFWFSYAASGIPDRRMEARSRVLWITMEFVLEDSMQICIDSCFWPPSGRVQFGAGILPPYTFRPKIWDDYAGEEEFCFRAYLGASDVKELPGSEDSRPSEFSLSQNYPNPFNPATNFQFTLSKSVHVKIEIFNIVGQNVKTLVDDNMTPGVYVVDWDGKDDKGNLVSSGIYFYRIQAGDFSDMKKMVLLK